MHAGCHQKSQVHEIKEYRGGFEGCLNDCTVYALIGMLSAGM